MALDNFDSVKRKNIINFFKDKFNIDLNNYDEDEISVIYREINDNIDQVIEEETKKYEDLQVRMREEHTELLNLINQYADLNLRNEI